MPSKYVDRSWHLWVHKGSMTGGGVPYMWDEASGVWMDNDRPPASYLTPTSMEDNYRYMGPCSSPHVLDGSG